MFSKFGGIYPKNDPGLVIIFVIGRVREVGGRYERVRRGERGGVVVLINHIFQECLALSKYPIITYWMNG